MDMKEKPNLNSAKDDKNKETGNREIKNFTNENQPLVVSPAAVLLFLSNCKLQDKHFV